MQPEERRACTQWLSGVWSPGKEEKKSRPGLRATGGLPGGSPIIPPPSCSLWLGTQRERGWGGRAWPLSLQRSVHWPQMIIAFNELQLVKGFEARRQSLSAEDSFS